MKETFRKISFEGKLKVRFDDSSGASQIWTIDQETLLSRVVQIVGVYEKQRISLTSRQLYYQLVAMNWIPNAEKVYKRICKFIADARYAGYVDWDSIEDRGRVPTMHSEWNNVRELVDSAVRSYRLPRWLDQEFYLELFCEKQALESVLKPVANKYHIYFGYNKGYSSASTLYDLSKRIIDKIREGKRCRLLYFGDHDPSGLDMVRDLNDRLNEFISVSLEDDDCGAGYDFEVVPLALNMAQIQKYNPPPNPAKTTDTRSSKYISEFGNESWELDALKPEVLVDIAEKGIARFFDEEKYDAWIEKEQEQKDKLQKYADEMSEED